MASLLHWLLLHAQAVLSPSNDIAVDSACVIAVGAVCAITTSAQCMPSPLA
jgi:hypothetical protein